MKAIVICSEAWGIDGNLSPVAIKRLKTGLNLAKKAETDYILVASSLKNRHGEVNAQIQKRWLVKQGWLSQKVIALPATNSFNAALNAVKWLKKTGVENVVYVGSHWHPEDMIFKYYAKKLGLTATIAVQSVNDCELISNRTRNVYHKYCVAVEKAAQSRIKWFLLRIVVEIISLSRLFREQRRGR